MLSRTHRTLDAFDDAVRMFRDYLARLQQEPRAEGSAVHSTPTARDRMLHSRAVTIASVAGTVLQLAMVLAGNSNASIANVFAVGGMGISLLAGVVYALQAREGSANSVALGGLIAGGVCALIGIAVSYALGDVPAMILVVGTLSSAVTGAIGGWLGRFAFGGGRRTA